MADVTSSKLDALEPATLKLLEYCRLNDFAGYEPYDALNSPVIAALPFLNFHLPRLILTQTLKRSPIDFRRLLLIEKTQNPKALAIFLSAFLKLSRTGIAVLEGDIEQIIQRLIVLRSTGVPYWCWGYSFPWQMRTGLVPIFAPNLVCTYFVADALLDVYEQRQDERCLKMAVSAAEYFINDLFWQNDTAFGFAYPLPTNRGQVHNANFLAAALLCRVYKITGDERFLDPALKITRYSAMKQNADGSWYYGEAPHQRWIDNFHTGYNLGALRSIGRSLDTSEFDSSVRRGFEFYRKNFFRPGGAVRYFHDRNFPIDTHCVAQAILTLLDFKDLATDNVEVAKGVFQWVMKHMWDERGYFYYRVLRVCTIRTSYIRWTQAWMLLALTALALEEKGLPQQPQLNSAQSKA